MRRFFHNELETMRSHLTLMGEKAIEATRLGFTSLIEKDVALAEQVIAGDDAIDDLEIEIDQEATRYLTLRAPVASDLRLITVAIKASHDLERVGDEAHTIAKRSRKLLVKGCGNYNLGELPQMADKVVNLFEKALECFIQEDAERAREVLAGDQEVDDLNAANIKFFIKQAKMDPNDINCFVDLIFISKSLERIADHATNLAEEVIFLTTAQETRHRA
ncbi:MAG: phosphate signaling complex protein PhoU [Opitutales bacterium]|jgi:phosphate transport system protein